MMNESVLNAFKVIFHLGFTLHNLEEAICSKNRGKCKQIPSLLCDRR